MPADTLNMAFLLPWLRSDIRLKGRFVVQWLKGFERVACAGEELTAYGLVATFPAEPPKRAMRVLIDVNGRKLSARIVPQKIEPVDAQFKCRCKFTMMGPREQRELTEVLENAPSPPYKRDRIERPQRSPVFKRRAVSKTLTVPAEIEAKVVALLIAFKKLAPPTGNQRPLLAIKSAQPLTEEGVPGTQYRVRSRVVDSHGVTKTFDTEIFVPNKGDARILT